MKPNPNKWPYDVLPPGCPEIKEVIQQAPTIGSDTSKYSWKRLKILRIYPTPDGLVIEVE